MPHRTKGGGRRDQADGDRLTSGRPAAAIKGEKTWRRQRQTDRSELMLRAIRARRRRSSGLLLRSSEFRHRHTTAVNRSRARRAVGRDADRAGRTGRRRGAGHPDRRHGGRPHPRYAGLPGRRDRNRRRRRGQHDLRGRHDLRPGRRCAPGAGPSPCSSWSSCSPLFSSWPSDPQGLPRPRTTPPTSPEGDPLIEWERETAAAEKKLKSAIDNIIGARIPKLLQDSNPPPLPLGFRNAEPDSAIFMSPVCVDGSGMVAHDAIETVAHDLTSRPRDDVADGAEPDDQHFHVRSLVNRASRSRVE